MYVQTGKVAVAPRSIWNRVRFQLGIGLLLAVTLPYLIRYQLEFRDGDISSLHNSLIASTAALISGYYVFRRTSRYPGVRASYHILPAFAVTYGLALAIFFMGRFDYSRLHFLSSFVIAVGWYFAVYYKLQRQQRLCMGVVPHGDIERLFGIKGVTWIPLDEHNASSAFDAIVADLRAEIPEQWQRYLADRALEGTLIMHVKQVQESLTGKVAIDHLSENNFGSLIPGIVYGKVKRVADLVLAVVAIPIILLFMGIVAVLIRMDSPGPAFFTQERMGYRGRVFTMYKFRTMTHERERPEDPRLAAMTRDSDHRVTRIGRFLRRTRLDELPQIFNILKGQMSWIGPRPEAVPLSRWYEAELPFYRYRHIVRPGISGWAQVKQGHVADVDEVLGKLHYDFYYIKNFSFWLDLLIVVGTIRTVLSGFGAR